MIFKKDNLKKKRVISELRDWELILVNCYFNRRKSKEHGAYLKLISIWNLKIYKYSEVPYDFNLSNSIEYLSLVQWLWLRDFVDDIDDKFLK